LREAIRPLNNPPASPIDSAALLRLVEKILFVLVEFETTEQAVIEFVLTREDVIFINQFLSLQDGDWAAGILKQSRRALYELRTGVLPSYTEDVVKLWKGVTSEQPSGEHD